MLLRVLGPASGVCLALGPVFPEIVHRGPSLNWSGGGGGGISPLGELLTFVLCLCVYVCINIIGIAPGGSRGGHGPPTFLALKVGVIMCLTRGT